MRETRETTGRKAVYFDTKDYAGPVRRITILGIDIVALIAIAFGVALGVVVCERQSAEEAGGKVLLLMLLVGYIYVTLVQRSRIGTLGYLLTGVRIVDIEGRRPSLLQMTVRLIPLLPVPWSLLLDLGWMLDDPGRQTLRDKWAGTFVVKRKAQPLGQTTVTYKRVYFSGLQLIIPEVGPRDSSLPTAPPGSPAVDTIPTP